MDRRQAMQAEVRRQQKKNVAVQRVAWAIIALLIMVGCVFGFFKVQDMIGSPLAAALKYASGSKGRKAMRADGYQMQSNLGGSKDFPSLYRPTIKDNWVEVAVDASGQQKPYPEKQTKFETLKDATPVQVQVVIEGEKVKTEKEGDRTGKPDTEIYQRWQKQRDGQINAKGKWKLIAEVVQKTTP